MTAPGRPLRKEGAMHKLIVPQTLISLPLPSIQPTGQTGKGNREVHRLVRPLKIIIFNLPSKLGHEEVTRP